MSEERTVREIRLEKLARLRELGLDPFSQERFERTDSATGLKRRFDEHPAEVLESQTVSFAGRVVSYRLMGKAGFAHLSDGDDRIQVYCRRDDLTPEEWEAYLLLDLGDHVGVEGFLFLTKTGERSLHVKKLVPLSKCLEVLPLGQEKDGQSWNRLSDVETRFRHRHLDLIANPESRRTLVDRARMVSAVRRYFDSVDYLEVETPMLQVVAGGAAAKPFVTHFNFYELDVKLRISLELYLKRLICGDLPRVYEVGRVFRNEKVSERHNPEFTLLEFYEAYANLEDMMRRVEELFAFVSNQLFGTTVVTLTTKKGEDLEVDFSQPWQRVDMLTEITRESGLSLDDLADLETAKKAILAKGVLEKAREREGEIVLEKETYLGGLIEKLLEVFVEPLMQRPTFVVNYPLETSPLAKKDPSRPGFTRRFEGYVLGREVCNAFSEINDPIDQRERFMQQAAQLEKGDDEAHPFDEEFLYALECGMPPTGGCGIGMERMAMILTGAPHIRQALMFPFMKPKLEGD